MTAQSEEEFLKLLAERPTDRSLRLVFCDWLLERDDPRGEAMSLFDKGSLSGVERRRLAHLQAANARKWLGPLADAAVLEGCRFAGGLAHTVRLAGNVSSDQFAALTGEPRLATVEALAIEPGRVASLVGGFLAHPVLGRVVHFESDVGTLVASPGLSFAPQVLKATLWHPREDLVALRAYAPAQSATVLILTTVDFVNPEYAEELADAVVASGVLAGRKRFELDARYATLEGATRWLRVAAARVRGMARGPLQRWAVTHGETHLALEGERFDQFTIDVMGEGELTVGQRLATAAAVLSLMNGVGVRRVEVGPIPGGRARKGELDALRAAARRLSNLEEFRVGGVPLSP